MVRVPGHFQAQGAVSILDFTGTLTGAFGNAAVGDGLLVGSDAVRVTAYGPAGTGVIIDQAVAAPGGVATGTELDGTGYTIKLTGPGH